MLYEHEMYFPPTTMDDKWWTRIIAWPWWWFLHLTIASICPGRSRRRVTKKLNFPGHVYHSQRKNEHVASAGPTNRKKIRVQIRFTTWHWTFRLRTSVADEIHSSIRISWGLYFLSIRSAVFSLDSYTGYFDTFLLQYCLFIEFSSFFCAQPTLFRGWLIKSFFSGAHIFHTEVYLIDSCELVPVVGWINHRKGALLSWLKKLIEWFLLQKINLFLHVEKLSC